MLFFVWLNTLEFTGNQCSKICIAWRKALKVRWKWSYLKANVCTIHKQGIKSVTNDACNNPMFVCGRNWSEFCVNRVVIECKRDLQ